VETTKKVETLIIGGGPGGRTAYAALHRLGKKKSMLVMNLEPTVVCSLPYGVGRRLIPGGPEDAVVDISKSPRLPRDIVQNTIIGSVISINTEEKVATIKTQASEYMHVSYDNVILATGAVPWIPPIEGVLMSCDHRIDNEDFSGEVVCVGNQFVPKASLAKGIYVMRTANDARALDKFAQEAQSAIIIGSGAIGLEVAEALADRGLTVTIVEALPHLTPALDKDMAKLLEKRIEERGIKVITEKQATSYHNGSLTLNDGTTLEASGVVFATGVRPDTRLAAKIGIKVEKGIVVNKYMQTNIPNIYAIGDATQIENTVSRKTYLPLIGTLAMRQALIAALNIAGKPTEHPPATSWGVSTIFDLHWGSVGLTEELAASLGMKAAAIVMPVRTREPAMPEGKSGQWKIIFSTEPADSIKKGQILGFQIILDGESPLSTVERFLDMIVRHETIPELIGHFHIHSPSHNPPDDPYMGIMFRYGIN